MTILLFLVTGLAAATFMPHLLPRFVAGRLGGAFLLGVGLHGTLLYLLGVLGVPLHPTTMAAIPAAAAVVTILRWRRVMRIRWRASLHELASTVAITAPFLILLWTTSIVPLADYDGRTTWMPKAHAIADEQSIRGPYFHGQRGLNLHNRYPLLMPLNAASAEALGGNARSVYVLIAPALLLAVRDLLERRYGRAWTSWCFAAVAWLPPIVLAAEGGATSAYSDLAVAAFFGMAVVTRATRGRAVFAPGLWCAFLILTKNEGLLLAAAVLVYRPRWRMLAAPLAALTMLGVWQQSIPDAYDERNAFLIRELPQQLARIDDAALAIGRRAMDVRTWGVFWPLVVVAALTRRQPRAAIVPLAIAAAGYVAVMACTSWQIEELARVTAHRLLTHGVIPAACVVAAALSSRSLPSVRPRYSPRPASRS